MSAERYACLGCGCDFADHNHPDVGGCGSCGDCEVWT